MGGCVEGGGVDMWLGWVCRWGGVADMWLGWVCWWGRGSGYVVRLGVWVGVLMGGVSAGEGGA